MAPLMETTMTNERGLFKAFQRSRSLGSIDVNSFDDPFKEDDFNAVSCQNDEEDTAKSPPDNWFEEDNNDTNTGTAQEDPFATPKAEVHYDCFGFALFELEADSAVAVKPTRVKTLPIPAPEADEKCPRKVRRRRSSISTKAESTPRQLRKRVSVSAGAVGSLPLLHLAPASPKSKPFVRRTKSGDSHNMTKMRRSKSSGGVSLAGTPDASASPSKGAGNKMRRCRSNVSIEASNDQMPSPTNTPPKEGTGSKLRRSKSSGNGINQHGKTRKRYSSTRKPRTASDAARELMSAMDTAQKAAETNSPRPVSPELETPKSTRRCISTRNRLRKSIADPAKNHSEGKERRRARRVSDPFSSPTPTKRLTRVGRSLTALNSALLVDQRTSRPLVSTTNIHF